ncbi:MAG: zinc ribbon domain-containing protein [Lachnospiraceae bacterium]|nr:zinc ribbon domain-containing protein [Lachnospiraceae bacterium]
MIQNNIAAKVNENCRLADEEVEAAISALGLKYYNENRNNPEAKYPEDIDAIKKLKAKSYMWNQYRLSLDGKRMCEKCKATITSDSLFCNKCGTSLKELDFSSFEAELQSAAPAVENVCPQCGTPVEDGALFCETCGMRLA